MKLQTPIILLVSASLLLTACASATAQAEAATAIPTVIADPMVIAEGRVEPVRYAKIGFMAGGVVSEVLVAEGDTVKEGQLIAQLSNSEAKQAELARAEEDFLTAEQALDGAQAEALKEIASAYEELRLAQIALDNFDIPSDFSGLTPAEAVTQMQAAVEKARADYEPYRNFARRSPTRSEYTSKEYGFKDYTHYDQTARNYKKALDSAWSKLQRAVRWAELEASLQAAKARADRATQDYENLVSTDSNKNANAKARFNTALANLNAARAALADLELRAPFDGVLADIDLRPGETVDPGQTIASVADFSAWVVKTTDLTEIDIVDIEMGQPATVILDAIPDKTLEGSVQSISQTYTQAQGDILYDVTVVLNETLPQMRWGMTASIKLPR
jgi:multidrug resistance efflux pump